MEITTDLLKEAFQKLLTYSYFDKTDMVMRMRVAEFARSLSIRTSENDTFDNLLAVANGERQDLLEEWISKMTLCYYPKKLSREEHDDNKPITNIPSDETIVERLLIKVDMPIELCILDVAWILTFGYKMDSDLSDDSWGNRLDLKASKSGVRKGNALFKKYQNQYGEWWRRGLKAANEVLKDNKNVTILNFDITNYYHSIDFDFERLFTDYERLHPNDGIRVNSLTKVIIKIYEHYWELTQGCGIEVFTGDNKGKRPLPLSLLSAHILANYFLSPLDRHIKNTYRPLYYGRYVDDCMLVVKSESFALTNEEIIKDEFPGLLSFERDSVRFSFAQSVVDQQDFGGISRLSIQTDKLYVYRFDCKLPPSSLDEFGERQKERSSEFRFLTDDADDGAVNLEDVTLVSALDAEEEAGRRFNILEENKYRLSVYLAKLANRLAKYGTEYEHYDEVDKVFRYFRGNLLIKHYVLWERLLTIFVLAGKKNYAHEFFQRAEKQIGLMQYKEGLFGEHGEEGLEMLCNMLVKHLQQSMLMALSLHKEADEIDTLYLDTYMVRMHYNVYPLQEFASEYKTEGVRLNAEQLKYTEAYEEYRWMPYYVKYYDIVCMLSIGGIYDPEVFKKAFVIYGRLNRVGEYIGATAFWHHLGKDSEISEFNTRLSIEADANDKITVSVVNIDQKDTAGYDQIKQYGWIDINKVLLCQRILDSVTKIPSTDIFVLPEMSLPLYELREYCLYSARNERAFVAGMEYVVSNKKVYNYIVTCLPVTLYGRRDAVPVIRLKNHYAPEEVKTIRKHKMRVPKNKKVWQNLYHWRNHTFTTYYCYELASIKERSFFFSKLDAMYCPVFNPDTYYFNNIAESLVRDMHCYFILSNVSHFGDSRVTQPSKHDFMNVMKVKGGNTKENKAVVLSAELEIDKLRNFQLLTETRQKRDGTFKQTPPDYDKDEVKKRMKSKFLFEFERDLDDFIARLSEMIMQY